MAIKKTTEQVALELKEKYQLVLRSEYLGAHSKITFLCSNGHENEAMATNVLQRGFQCKQCKYDRPIKSISWTDDKVIKLIELIEQGTTLETIANRFNTTEAAINNACAKFDISNSKTIRSRFILEEVLNADGRTLLSKPFGLHDYAEIMCSNGHITKQLVSNIVSGTGCPRCFSKTGVSAIEKELREFIQHNYSGWIEYNDRSILEGKELDIVLPDLGLAIELDGTYWHQEDKVGRLYHKNKTDAIEAVEYQLIHITDYQWTNKKDIVKSRILNKLGKSIKIPARKTTIKEVPSQEAKLFLEANHIQGYAPASINLGLYTSELVAIMTFAKPRFSNEADFELVRYASKLGTLVQGGASKLFNHRPKGIIISYADRSFSNGNLYKKLGFILSHTTEPGYAYYKRDKRLSRYQCQKHKLADLLPLYDPKLSEAENMKLNGYYKVYDCGNLVFMYHPST